MRARYFVRLLSFVLLLGGLSSPASAWWDKEWTVRKKVTLDTSVPDAAIAEPIGPSTVLLRLRDGNFQFGAAKEDGSDIRILAEDDKTLLTYHLERYDSVLNEGFLWINVPEIKPGAKLSFWLYYGNQGQKATVVSNAKGSYDAQTSLVYHFGEKSGPPADATGKSGMAENGGTPITGSLIGGGVRIDGKTPIKVPPGEALVWGEGAPMTWTAWVKPTALAKDAVIFSRREGDKFFVVGLDAGKPYLEVPGGRVNAAAAAAVTPNTWLHLAAVADAGKVTLYINGESPLTVNAALPALATPLLIGGDTAEGATGFAGEIDEMTIAKAARPAGALKLAALSQGTADKADKMLTFGQDEKSETSWLEGNGTFAIIVKHTLEDKAAVAVIIILSFMLVLSWYVMFNKISYLNGQAKGNAKFMKAWANIANDLTVLDHGNDQETTKSLGGRLDKKALRSMRASAVYRIYHIGVQEIRHRLMADHTTMELSARSIQSVRASLDGGLVREKQKIDSQIVMLTICIAGGPFIGLLGTVIGVMITFAAVAAAGDVNVNAIAPGIAAALLATVAGLTVAIPALFGYNYINSRVKDATADMHVFIDEFITRMAEFYSDAKPGGRGTTSGHSMIKALAPTPSR